LSDLSVLTPSSGWLCFESSYKAVPTGFFESFLQARLVPSPVFKVMSAGTNFLHYVGAEIFEGLSLLCESPE